MLANLGYFALVIALLCAAYAAAMAVLGNMPDRVRLRWPGLYRRLVVYAVVTVLAYVGGVLVVPSFLVPLVAGLGPRLFVSLPLIVAALDALTVAAVNLSQRVPARVRNTAWVASAHRAALLTWPLVTLAALCLIGLLVTQQYQIDYVARVTSRAMPLYLKITAWWGGQAGSLLFWSWLMATCTA